MVQSVLYLGRHDPIERARLPQSLRTPSTPASIALRTLPNAARHAAHEPRSDVVSFDRPGDWGGASVSGMPARTISARLLTAERTVAQDTLLTQMPDGDVFADVSAASDQLRKGSLRVAPADEEAFLARYKQNTLSPGARAHCFCNGTFMHTPRGPVPIEDIRVGFPVRTLDDGVQPVRWIGTTLHTEPRAHAPIEIAAGALGRGFPASTLRVSPHHRLCLRSSIAERMFGQAEVLLPARFLLDVPGVHQIDGELPVRYWHIATAKHALVAANGTWAETLFPGLAVPKGMNASDVSQLEVVFEQILARGKEDAQRAQPPVRPILRGASQRAFVARHLKQRRAFIMQDADPDEDEPQHASAG